MANANTAQAPLATAGNSSSPPRKRATARAAEQIAAPDWREQTKQFLRSLSAPLGAADAVAGRDNLGTVTYLLADLDRKVGRIFEMVEGGTERSNILGEIYHLEVLLQALFDFRDTPDTMMELMSPSMTGCEALGTFIDMAHDDSGAAAEARGEAGDEIKRVISINGEDIVGGALRPILALLETLVHAYGGDTVLDDPDSLLGHVDTLHAAHALGKVLEDELVRGLPDGCDLRAVSTLVGLLHMLDSLEVTTRFSDELLCDTFDACRQYTKLVIATVAPSYSKGATS